MGYVQGVDRRQVILFPEVVDDYIEEDNPVQFVDAFVDSLDLVELGFKYCEPEATGRPPYNPGDMLKLYLYGYLNRIRSSRCLERETGRNIELMWLVRKLTPDFKTIADFRKDNRTAIKKVCREFIFLCKKLELFGGELIAIDGSKFKAVNSKKRNFTDKKLKRRIKEVEDKIEKYLQELEENDRMEESHEKENGGSHMDPEGLKEKIKLLKERGEEYKRFLKGLEESGETQVSLTDPDSRAMLNKQRVEVCYNVQFTTDDKHKLIVDHDVTNEATDAAQLSRMGKRAKKILGVEKIDVLTDKAYYNGIEIKECVDDGIIPYIPEPRSTVSKKIDVPRPEFYKDKFKYDKERDVYICPEGFELEKRSITTQHNKKMRRYMSEECTSCKTRELCTRNKKGRIIYRWEHEHILEEMRERVKREEEKVKKRSLITEHVFGTMKRGFNQGYLLMKGKDKVGAEMALSVLTYNIKRVLNIVGLRQLIEMISKKIPLRNGIKLGTDCFLYVFIQN